MLVLDSGGLSHLAERNQDGAATIRVLVRDGLWPPLGTRTWPLTTERRQRQPPPEDLRHRGGTARSLGPTSRGALLSVPARFRGGLDSRRFRRARRDGSHRLCRGPRGVSQPRRSSRDPAGLNGPGPLSIALAWRRTTKAIRMRSFFVVEGIQRLSHLVGARVERSARGTDRHNESAEAQLSTGSRASSRSRSR